MNRIILFTRTISFCLQQKIFFYQYSVAGFVCKMCHAQKTDKIIFMSVLQHFNYYPPEIHNK